MGTQRLEERFAYSGGKVRRPGVDGFTGRRPVVEGVLLCGPTSANRRRYKAQAFAGDRVKRYDGRPVFFNHATGSAPRQYESRIAKVINPRLRADGMPVGDLEVRPKHPFAEAFLDDAEHDPGSIGMSHVAHCKTERAQDGWDDVTEMVEAESVDVVMDPATTKGLYESTRRSAVATFSLRKFVERFGPKWGAKKWAAATKLCEDIGAVADAPVMDEPPAETSDGDLKSALMAAITPMLDEAFESGDANKVCSAIKDFIKLHAKHTGKDTGSTPADDDTGGDAEESKKRPKGLAGYIAEAEGFGLKEPTTKQLAVLETIPTRAGRELYCCEAVERTGGGGRETPVSSGKKPGSGTAPDKGKGGTTTVTKESAPPTDPAAYAKWLNEG